LIGKAAEPQPADWPRPELVRQKTFTQIKAILELLNGTGAAAVDFTPAAFFNLLKCALGGRRRRGCDFDELRIITADKETAHLIYCNYARWNSLLRARCF
jgi:hypothetical protein